MENGSMSLYTLFLMSGGMTVPYIWGVLFLNEKLTIFRTLGLVAIIAAIIIAIVLPKENNPPTQPIKEEIQINPFAFGCCFITTEKKTAGKK